MHFWEKITIPIIWFETRKKMDYTHTHNYTKTHIHTNIYTQEKYMLTHKIHTLKDEHEEKEEN